MTSAMAITNAPAGLPEEQSRAYKLSIAQAGAGWTDEVSIRPGRRFIDGR
jgi:hypothetical protein